MTINNIRPSVHKWTVTGLPAETGTTCALGAVYRFPLNSADAATLPHLEWTSIRLGEVAVANTAPNIWRAAALNPAACVEVEDMSDAGLRTMREEAVACWEALRLGVLARAKWMKLIGVHPTIQERALEAVHCRWVSVYTLQDDFLASMFALGSQEAALMAGILHRLETDQDNEPIGAVSLTEFLWPREAALEPWQLKRYENAVAGGFLAVQSSFSQS